MARGILPVCLLLTTAACLGTGTRVVSLPDPSVRPVANIRTISDYPVAAASIVEVLERDFGFRRFPVAFYFCPDRQAFEEMLLDSGYDAAFARQTARTMDAVGGYRRVLLNESALERQDWPGRVASLAHEVGHSLQYEWGGGQRRTSDQWLREGFAEWLAMRVMDRLGGVTYGQVRRQYADALRRTRRARSPRLDEMVTFREWVELASRQDIAPYAQAFLSVDFLIERHGLPAVVDYFERFARDQDRESNFRAAFGENLAAFESAVTDALWR
ncbi:MAG TPA: hypothetical protein VK886_00495 [Vicinamibacterales bacterium]|nr:hypothetical protein [Vicinamibacterales bacterium]